MKLGEHRLTLRRLVRDDHVLPGILIQLGALALLAHILDRQGVEIELATQHLDRIFGWGSRARPDQCVLGRKETVDLVHPMCGERFDVSVGMAHETGQVRPSEIRHGDRSVVPGRPLSGNVLDWGNTFCTHGDPDGMATGTNRTPARGGAGR
jgi:hypothetical protein